MSPPQSVRPLRIFIYVQHLSGVGHLVRAQQIGVALARRHQVSILDGGRPVQFSASLEAVTVPALERRAGEIRPLDGSLGLAEAFALRRQHLQTVLQEQRPDVVVVEHFPFSKWELQEEIEYLLETARRANPVVIAIASLRDVSLRTRHETRRAYENTVLQLLHRHFDSLLVHADPQLCQFGDYFGASARVTVPVFHTGVVAAPLEVLRGDTIRRRIGTDKYLVASTGGGADGADLMPRVVAAWRLLAAVGRTGRHRLLLFSGLDGYPPAVRRLLDGEPSIIAMGFDPQFKGWLQGAALSISCAGYNTCANLLVSRTPALLMPNPAMSDQSERARLMSTSGVAVTIPAGVGDVDLAEMIAENLGQPRTDHRVQVDGAEQSARFIERRLSGFPGQ